MLSGRQRGCLWGAALFTFLLVLLTGASQQDETAPQGLLEPASLRPMVESTWLARPQPRHHEVALTALRHNLDPALVMAVIQVESGFVADAVSPAGAVGLMQVMPATAEEMGLPDVADPAVNLEAGCRYLAALLEVFGGDVELALAGYNAGPGAVRRWGTIPPYRETQNFVRRVAAAYHQLTGVELASASPLVTPSSPVW